MKRRIDLSKTFREVRKLPLGVSFEQVEQWVNASSAYPLKPRSRWWKWWLQWNANRWHN